MSLVPSSAGPCPRTPIRSASHAGHPILQHSPPSRAGLHVHCSLPLSQLSPEAFGLPVVTVCVCRFGLLPSYSVSPSLGRRLCWLPPSSTLKSFSLLSLWLHFALQILLGPGNPLLSSLPHTAVFQVLDAPRVGLPMIYIQNSAKPISRLMQ